MYSVPLDDRPADTVDAVADAERVVGLLLLRLGYARSILQFLQSSA